MTELFVRLDACYDERWQFLPETVSEGRGLLDPKSSQIAKATVGGMLIRPPFSRRDLSHSHESDSVPH